MSQDQALQLLQQGIAAAKAKQNEEARQLLQNAIRLDPGNETAWLWLSSVAKDQKERAFCLQQILQINPANEMALKGLKAMGMAAQPQQVAAPKSTIPIPSAEQIAAAQSAADPILQQYSTPEDPYAHIEWTHKDRRRAGERAATLFKLGVRLAPIVILICLATPVVWFISTNPGAIAFAPTWTPSWTPTSTSTPTPGFTPTPSPTPELTYTPSPTLDPILPVGSLDEEMTSTPVNPPVGIGANPLRAAVVALDQGNYSDVLPTLQAERNATENRFDASPYYFEAIARTEIGDTEGAERILQEALARIEEEVREAERPEQEGIIQAGLAYVYAAMGEYDDSNAAADEAVRLDQSLRQPFITLVENALLVNDVSAAAEVLAEGLLEHPDDVNLWILRGQVNLRRGQAPDAQQDARVALSIDPTAEDAYLLQAQADMATGDYGLAVLHLQSYLFIYPGSIEGWAVLGDARRLEGNLDLAIAAYSRAVNTEEKLPIQIPSYLARADQYLQRNLYTLAQADYAAILAIDEDSLPAREGRARAAFLAGRYGEALEDLEVLIEQLPDRHDLQLLRAQALVDGANPAHEETYTEALDSALNILSGSFPATLDGSSRAQAYEYRSRILFTREFYRDALRDIDLALAEEESGSRHFWRGRIEQEQGNLENAQREFEWVRLWGSIYSYPFLPEAIRALESITAATAAGG